MRKPLFLSRLKISHTFKILIFLLCSGFSTLSLISFNLNLPYENNWIGSFGGLMSYSLVYAFGMSSLAIPCFLWWMTFQIIVKEKSDHIRKKSFYFLMLLLSSNFLLSIPDSLLSLPFFLNKKIFKHANHYCLGGVPFHILYSGKGFISPLLSFKKVLGTIGSIFLFTSLWITSFIYFTGLLTPKWIKIRSLFSKKIFDMHKKKQYIFQSIKKIFSKKQYLPGLEKIDPDKIENITKAFSNQASATRQANPTPHPKNRSLSISCLSKALVIPERSQNSKKPSYHALPQHTLLSKGNTQDHSSIKEILEKQALILKDTLSEFGIDISLGAICSGPTLTAFEILPQAGVKVQKIKALENDIALNLQASSIRIIAPIPGKAAVGIEIPNPRPQTVAFRELLESYLKQNQKLHIPLLLGKKANGDNLWTDLAAMPHLIIAGTTGSGKSVCINTIITSIIMTTGPSDIKLMIIDPKKVELTGYSNLPHMLSPVITEGRSAHNALLWLVKEMENRYEILRRLSLRNIQGFNSRTRSAQEREEHPDIPEKFPFIVGIIDELADLLLSSSQDMETPIIRIAQMARAVGIHMILATQRPSRDVITGLIKANFPSRIAFKVSSRVNSQIIIDEPGAENLMGNGDMLLLIPNNFGTIRAQGAYVKDEDINVVIKDLCNKFPTEYMIPSFEDLPNREGRSPFSNDPLFQEAANIVLSTGNAATTFLQRKLKIGYARAAGLMDELELSGIIGPSEGAKPRRIIGTRKKNPLE